MSQTASAHDSGTLFGHPKGLYVLFFTEMWERFSYYGMRALLTLYMYTSAAKGGLGWDKADALSLYGWYTMFVYVASIPGGIIADRMLGQKMCVLLGGLFLCAGHGIMAVPEIWAFYTALTLIVIGVGLLKPNISTMVGGLYRAGDPRRDRGFAIFYTGINVGAAAASLIVGWVGEKIGWHYGFGLAGIGMALGQLQFMLGRKHLTHVGNFSRTPQTEGHVDHAKPLTKIERDRIFVLLVSFLIVIVFFGAFEQAGGLMSIYTDEKVDRHLGNVEIPASVFQSLNPIFIILFASVVAGYWFKRQLKGKESSSILKMGVGTMIMGLGFVFMVFAANEGSAQEEAGKQTRALVLEAGWPGASDASATGYWESVRPPFAQAFAAAKERDLGDEEAESLGMQAIAPLVEAQLDRVAGDAPAEVRDDIRYGLEAVATVDEDDPQSWEDVAKASYASTVHASASMFWLILAYLFHTIGELCLSPVALSFITKLAPAKFASLMMGIFFAVTGLGNKVAGLIGESVASYSEYAIFAGITVFTIVFGALLLVFLRPLKRLTHGAEDFVFDDDSEVVDEG